MQRILITIFVLLLFLRQDTSSLLVIGEKGLRVYLNDEYRGAINNSEEGFFLDNLKCSDTTYLEIRKGLNNSVKLLDTIIELKPRKTTEVFISSSTGNFYDFRNDGYYIMKDPIILSYKERVNLYKNLGFNVRGSKEVMYFFFSFRDVFKEGDYAKVLMSGLTDKHSSIKKLYKKYDTSYNLINNIFPRDRVVSELEKNQSNFDNGKVRVFYFGNDFNILVFAQKGVQSVVIGNFRDFSSAGCVADVSVLNTDKFSKNPNNWNKSINWVSYFDESNENVFKVFENVEFLFFKEN